MKFGLLGLLLMLTGCFAHPNITLNAEPRPPIEVEKVAVLTALPPSPFIDMARVYGWSPIPVDTLKGFDDAVEKLRERAASIGANAVVVPKREEFSWPVIRSQWMWPNGRERDEDEEVRPTELMGRAIYIEP